MDLKLDNWSEEMWDIWEKECGIVHIDGKPYECGVASETTERIVTTWLRPKGKDLPLVYSDVKRNDSIYIDGTDEFRLMVEAVKLVQNIINAKKAGEELKGLTTG